MGSKASIFRFANIEVREREFSLIKAGKSLPVEPKAFRVLLILLHHPQKLITKEELLNAVWGDAAVTENSLTRSIALLRRLLGDETRSPRYIETVATVGYRFVCPVEVDEDSNVGVSVPDEPTGPNSAGSTESTAKGKGADSQAPIENRANGQTKTGLAKKEKSDRFLKWLLPGAVVVVVGLATGAWYLAHPSPPLRITEYNQITHDGQNKILVGTDGNRLYLTLLDPLRLGQVPVTGGRISQMSVGVENPWLEDVSPDGSSLLVRSPNSSMWEVGVLGNSARRIAAAAEEAAWSPDKKFVVYSTPKGDIFVLRIDGMETRLLNPSVTARLGANEHADTHDLTWSPDGHSIRFSRLHDLWEISKDGSNLHKVLPPGWRPSSWKCCGRWTRDGEFFVFLSGDTLLRSAPLLPGAQLWAINERRRLFRRAIQEPFPLTSGPSRWGIPVPSYDGKTLFANGVTVRGELVRLDSQSGQLKPYLVGISAEFLSFSPDGKSVAYVSFPEGILWRANLDGTGLVQLSDPPLYPKILRWSPDGTRILFSALAAHGKDVLYIVSPQGGNPQRVLPEDDGVQADANWSPDGKKIVFTSCACSWTGPRTEKNQLHILELAHHQRTTVPGSDDMWSPRWSPDGRFIAGRLLNGGGIKLFELSSQRWTTLLDQSAEWPSWSRDSHYIYFLQPSDFGVFRVPVAGGPAQRIVDLHGFHYTGWAGSWMGLDPTDAPLLLRDAGTDDIYALTMERR